jgi:hypothetical protein
MFDDTRKPVDQSRLATPDGVAEAVTCGPGTDSVLADPRRIA